MYTELTIEELMEEIEAVSDEFERVSVDMKRVESPMAANELMGEFQKLTMEMSELFAHLSRYAHMQRFKLSMVTGTEIEPFKLTVTKKGKK